MVADAFEHARGFDLQVDLVVGRVAAQAAALGVGPHRFDGIQFGRVAGEPVHGHTRVLSDHRLHRRRAMHRQPVPQEHHLAAHAFEQITHAAQRSPSMSPSCRLKCCRTRRRTTLPLLLVVPGLSVSTPMALIFLQPRPAILTMGVAPTDLPPLHVSKSMRYSLPLHPAAGPTAAERRSDQQPPRG